MTAAFRYAEKRLPAFTRHERLRLRCVLDAIVIALYALNRTDFAWILKDCDHPVGSENAVSRQLDPKRFWRVDRDHDAELRHTLLSLVAFDDLMAQIASAGDRDAGMEAFCNQNDGEGWMLPETLCIADLGMTRTVDVGVYDERARVPQPVRIRMGPRFFDWQLVAESPPSIGLPRPTAGGSRQAQALSTEERGLHAEYGPLFQPRPPGGS